MKNPQADKILETFLEQIRRDLGSHLKEVILFGSRARGDHHPDSDYDCLVIVDEISDQIKERIYDITGDFLYEYSVIFSTFPVTEERYHQSIYSPLMMNARREGIPLWSNLQG